MNESDIIELLTYSGSGGAKFGMTPGEIETILGAPDSVGSNYFKQRIEYRSFMNVGYSTHDNLAVHFGFGPQMIGTKFNDIFLFKEDPKNVLKKIVTQDGSPFLCYQLVVLLNLGLTLSGFHDNDESQKGVTLFERGTYDDDKDRMKPFKLKR